MSGDHKKDPRLDIARKDEHRLVLEIARLMGGLTIMEVQNILDQVQKLVYLSTDFDVNTDAFQEQVEAYNRVFQDDVKIGGKASG
ncbi:MAG: hypothetical protein OQJ97_10145 [Rhodospirillales bacterium]|nr:hypothetical protein [Rhodospirillales bacterium]